MKSLLIVVLCILIVISALWVYNKPSFSSLIAFLSSFSSLLAVFIIPKFKKNHSQKMKLGNKSKGFQAGRDINIKFSKEDK